nr:hypothetical protein CFP56_20978 [Quercus suber]
MECTGCKALISLITQHRRFPGRDAGANRTQLVHRSFRDLDHCAPLCKPCRVFRRAILLHPITGRTLSHDDTTAWLAPVYVGFMSSSDRSVLCVRLGSFEDLSLRSFVALDAEADCEIPAKRSSHDVAKLKRRLEHCHSSHLQCRRLSYSQNNPAFLVRIFEDDRAQVMSAETITKSYGSSLVQYVALTYAWGNKANMTISDWHAVKRVRLQAPYDNSSTNGSSFNRSSLVPTIRDAMTIAKDHFNVNFVWIDSLCIPQDSSGTCWTIEAQKMQEVYGNAYFTLAASSTQSALDPLLNKRSAWRYPIEVCFLNGQTLSTVDLPVSHVRALSPLCKRGWILQEELFSPRILYWTGERVYWCCLEQEYAEISQVKAPEQYVADCSSRPQQFLSLCYSGQDQGALEMEWLNLVSLLIGREFFDVRDRFAAISVLATCYLRATMFIKETKNVGQLQYLSGLWRQNFGRHLSWSVTSVEVRGNESLYLAPSWSWASLPPCTDMKYNHNFLPAEHFELLDFTLAEHFDCLFSEHCQMFEDMIRRGAYVRSVQVRGRLRSLVRQSTRPALQGSIIIPKASTLSSEDSRLSLSTAISLCSSTGRLVVRAGSSLLVEGQLDYLNGCTADLDLAGDSMESQVICLEIGKQIMLLLLLVNQEKNAYCRVGIASLHAAFFEDIDLADNIVLV